MRQGAIEAIKCWLAFAHYADITRGNLKISSKTITLDVYVPSIDNQALSAVNCAVRSVFEKIEFDKNIKGFSTFDG